MVRIFGLMSLLCALLALAVRQQVDLQDMAFQTRLNTSDERQASKAQVTVRQQHAISGHTSLNTMNVYSIHAVDGVCRDVIKKVSELANEELALSSTAGRSIDEDVDNAFLRDSSERSRHELSEAFAVLDQSDLRDVLNTGEIWTLGDQDILVRCETNQSIRIEEETQTATGEELLQGDVLVPSKECGSLLEMKMLVAGGARWAHDDNKWGYFRKASAIVNQAGYDGETYVPYCFDPDLDEGAKVAFLAAVEHTSSQVPCLHFVDVGYNDGRDPPPSLPLDSYEAKAHKSNRRSCSVLPSIIVQDTDRDRCWSPVGMNRAWSHARSFKAATEEDSSQPLNLGYPCQTMAVAAHELGHALGMLHEQSRTDRDHYITVHWDNIPKDKQHNFNMQFESWQSQIYDPLSLMHYEPNAFSEDTARPTITAKKSKITAVLGQRQGWSEQDVLELAGKYCVSEGHRIMTDLGAKVHKARPKVTQQAILERLVGSVSDFKPVAKFSQLIVPSSKPNFCVKFFPVPQEWLDDPKWAVQGCDVNSGLRTGFCQWHGITNVCNKRVRISCPHEDPDIPMIFESKAHIGGYVMEVTRFFKDGTRWVKEPWKELEMGLCGVYVDP